MGAVGLWYGAGSVTVKMLANRQVRGAGGNLPLGVLNFDTVSFCLGYRSASVVNVGNQPTPTPCIICLFSGLFRAVGGPLVGRSGWVGRVG